MDINFTLLINLLMINDMEKELYLNVTYVKLMDNSKMEHTVVLNVDMMYMNNVYPIINFKK